MRSAVGGRRPRHRPIRASLHAASFPAVQYGVHTAARRSLSAAHLSGCQRLRMLCRSVFNFLSANLISTDAALSRRPPVLVPPFPGLARADSGRLALLYFQITTDPLERFWTRFVMFCHGLSSFCLPPRHPGGGLSLARAQHPVSLAVSRRDSIV